jgi:small GTP-binding protein
MEDKQNISISENDNKYKRGFTNNSKISEEDDNNFVVRLKTNNSYINPNQNQNDIPIDELLENHSKNNFENVLTNENVNAEKQINPINENNEDFEHKEEDGNYLSKEDFDLIRRFSNVNPSNISNLEQFQNFNNYDVNADNNSLDINSNIDNKNELYNDNDDIVECGQNENIEDNSPVNEEIKTYQENVNQIEKKTDIIETLKSEDFSNQIKFEKILNSKEECKNQFRICVIGDSNVGKTSLLNRYCNDQFNEAQTNTIGVDFKTLILKHNDIKIKLQIWDTAGQERFRSISVNYFKSAHGFIYVYDITKRNSLKNLDNWIDLVNQNNKNSACNFIIGNKKDLNNLREIGLKEGKDYAFSKKFNFMETSAKTNINIDLAFQIFSIKLIEYYNVRSDQKEIIEKFYLDSVEDLTNGNEKVKLEETKKKKLKKGCKC